MIMRSFAKLPQTNEIIQIANETVHKIDKPKHIPIKQLISEESFK